MKTLAAALVLGFVVGGAAVWGEDAATAPATAPAIASATAPASAPAAGAMTEQQRIGYTMGLMIGMNVKGVDVDFAALKAGLHDASTGATPQLSEKEMREAMMALQKKIQDAKDAFFVENGKKEGVVTTASGLQYKIIKSGMGKSPKATDTVSVNYRGTLLSGKEFDASRGKPVSFPVNRVIPGWTEALQLMKVGDQWTLYIPSKLAYGEEGMPQGGIGPNETLIFEVELLAVQ